MSASGPRYHIPFPSNFLSLNTPSTKKDTSGEAIPISPETEATHSFLSNRPVVARSSSISSESSISSVASVPASSATKVVESPTLKAAAPAFLTLNSKHTPPPSTAKEVQANKTPFLSNNA